MPRRVHRERFLDFSVSLASLTCPLIEAGSRHISRRRLPSMTNCGPPPLRGPPEILMTAALSSAASSASTRPRHVGSLKPREAENVAHAETNRAEPIHGQ